MQSRLDPLEDLVGDLFVDRHQELDFFWQWATRVPSPFPHDSHALIGRRRTGKTTVMVKLFNRLYHEQDRVLPVFVSFARYLKRPDAQISWGEFAEEYLTSYLRSYLAFRYREPRLLRDRLNLEVLRPVIAQKQDELALKLLQRYDQSKANPSGSVTGLADWVVNLPASEAYFGNMPTVVLIDEFQVLGNAFNEERNIPWGVTSLFQNAAETHWAPLLVSGSAVSTLIHEIFGGALFGRIRAHHLPPLPREYAMDLVFRLGKRKNIEVNEALAETIWQITAGHADSIHSVMFSQSPALQRFPHVEALEEVVSFELSNPNGNLRLHYKGEFDKYSTLLNSGQLTKKVMFWTTKYPDQLIDTEQIATELNEPVENVQTSLNKLHQIDIITPISGSRYNGPSDPMLRRYIAYHHHVEIEKLAPAEAIKDWKREYASLRGELNRFIGEVGEVYLQGVMQRFDGRTVEGETYFNQAGKALLPKFAQLERRGGIVKAGVPIEIDIQGQWQEAGNTLPSFWLVQVKNLKTPIGEDMVQHFLRQCETFLAQQPHTSVVRWYFSKSGFTRPARQLLEQAGVFYSDLHAFNQLATLFDFFGLPI